MFDIGFSEMLVIAVVALIVIGPERLPGVARTLGHLFGRMQRYVNDVKADIQREVELDELRKLRDNVESSAREIQQSVSRDFQAVEQEMHELQALANPAERAHEGKPVFEQGQGARGEQSARSGCAEPAAVPAAAGEEPKRA
jgi:sec-independent protein translocase protein TatB